MSTRTTVLPPMSMLDPPLGPEDGVPAGETVAGAGAVELPGAEVDVVFAATEPPPWAGSNGSRPENTSFCCWGAGDGLGVSVGAPPPACVPIGAVGPVAAGVFEPLCTNRK